MIPYTPASGCPFDPKDDFCCCETNCCWDECKLSLPPDNCLNNVSAVWEFDLAKGFWVAQGN